MLGSKANRPQPLLMQPGSKQKPMKRHFGKCKACKRSCRLAGKYIAAMENISISNPIAFFRRIVQPMRGRFGRISASSRVRLLPGAFSVSTGFGRHFIRLSTLALVYDASHLHVVWGASTPQPKSCKPQYRSQHCALRVVERLEAGAKLFAERADNIPGVSIQEAFQLLV